MKKLKDDLEKLKVLIDKYKKEKNKKKGKYSGKIEQMKKLKNELKEKVLYCWRVNGLYPDRYDLDFVDSSSNIENEYDDVLDGNVSLDDEFIGDQENENGYEWQQDAISAGDNYS